jgi:hypothetical protein
LVRLKPDTGTDLVHILFEGGSCGLAGVTELSGQLLGSVPRDNEEAMMSETLFETSNADNFVTPQFTEYELEGVKTTGVDPKFGANPVAVESTEQEELEPIGGKRGLFSAHT